MLQPCCIVQNKGFGSRQLTPALDVAAIAEDLFEEGNRVEHITEQGNE